MQLETGLDASLASWRLRRVCCRMALEAGLLSYAVELERSTVL